MLEVRGACGECRNRGIEMFSVFLRGCVDEIEGENNVNSADEVLKSDQ